MTKALPAGKKRIITRYRVVVSVLLASAFAIFYVAFTSSVDHKTVDSTNPRVVSVRPGPNELALRQDRIFAELDKAYTGVLIIDGREIPEDQLDHSEGLNTVGFSPGPGTEIGALQPGHRCASVVFWATTSSREASAQSYDWCWTVH